MLCYDVDVCLSVITSDNSRYNGRGQLLTDVPEVRTLNGTGESPSTCTASAFAMCSDSSEAVCCCFVILQHLYTMIVVILRCISCLMQHAHTQTLAMV
jgi:hypothetical protein